MRRESSRPWGVAVGAVLASLVVAPATASAWVIDEDELEETSTTVGAVMRSFAFVLAGDVLEPPYLPESENPTAMGLFDARLYFEHRASRWKIVAHEQLTLRLSSHAAGGPLSFGRGLRPPRWLPLTFSYDRPTLDLVSDLDWLYGSYSVGPVTFTVGRQPITFGRGTLWRTTDRISTFALTEVDRSYKPGADAIRIDIDPSDSTSLSLLAAVGERESDLDGQISLGGSSFVARFRQGWDGGEIGATGGFVRYDGLVGVDGLLDFGSFDLYGEVAATWVTDRSLSTPVVTDHGIPVMSAVLGATFKPVGALTLTPEVAYNGFGSFDPGDYLAIFASQRVGIGEQLGVGRLYAGLNQIFEITPLTHLFGATMLNLHDPSGLFLVGIDRDLAENVRAVLGGYAPVGRRPDVRALSAQSEYGNYPYFFFFELKATL